MSRASLAGLLYFSAVFAAGFVLGTLRVLLIEPAVGALVAVLLELPVILMVSWIAARWLVERLRIACAASARLVMGGTAFMLLMLAEVGLSKLLQGADPTAFLNELSTLPGLLGFAGQVAFALIPLMLARTG